MGKYKILVHCRTPQIREGLNVHLQPIAHEILLKHTDLAQDGMPLQLNFEPDLILVLLNCSDSDMVLVAKIHLFARNIPVVWITPPIPSQYVDLLHSAGIGRVVELPLAHRQLAQTIEELIETKLTVCREESMDKEP